MRKQMALAWPRGVGAVAAAGLLGSLATVATAGPVDFMTSVPSALVTADAAWSSTADSAGGPFGGFVGGLSVSFGADVTIDDFNFASASSSLDAAFTTYTIAAHGGVGTDAGTESDPAVADALSALEVFFTATEPASWMFTFGSVGGTHAGGTVGLYTVGGTPIVEFGSFFDGESGVLAPGDYKLVASVSAYTTTQDGFDGLFAGASFDFEFVVLPAPGSAVLGVLGVLGLVSRRR